MRLTQEQAAAVDAKAERDDVHVLAPDRILDLRDQLRDTTARAEQLEKDRDALAAEVRAWRAFDAACGVRDRIAYTAALRPVHPIDTMKATDASGALQRAKGGAA